MAMLSVATINKHLPLTNKYIYIYGERMKKRERDEEKEGGRDR